jgi:hypothetical protein
MVITKLNAEFKLFMRWRGINIDSQLFDLEFEEPQNFAQYRQAEIDAARIATFTQLEPFPYMSKRFLMKRYLGMSEMELKENEIMWKEEQGKTEEASAAEQANLRGVGITPGGIAGDLENVEMPAPDAGAIPGAEAGAPEMAGPAAGTPAAPAMAAAPAM